MSMKLEVVAIAGSMYRDGVQVKTYDGGTRLADGDDAPNQGIVVRFLYCGRKFLVVFDDVLRTATKELQEWFALNDDDSINAMMRFKSIGICFFLSEENGDVVKEHEEFTGVVAPVVTTQDFQPTDTFMLVLICQKRDIEVQVQLRWCNNEDKSVQPLGKRQRIDDEQAK